MLNHCKYFVGCTICTIRYTTRVNVLIITTLLVVHVQYDTRPAGTSFPLPGRRTRMRGWTSSLYWYVESLRLCVNMRMILIILSKCLHVSCRGNTPRAPLLFRRILHILITHACVCINNLISVHSVPQSKGIDIPPYGLVPGHYRKIKKKKKKIILQLWAGRPLN